MTGKQATPEVWGDLALMAADGALFVTHTRRLSLIGDGGGGNGSRVRLWKIELRKLANELGRVIAVPHPPPGKSK